MKVHVKLFAQLRKYHPGPNRSVPLVIVLPDYATPRDLVGRLELPRELVRNAFVNNEQHDFDSPLRDGDQVALFSPVVGG